MQRAQVKKILGTWETHDNAVAERRRWPAFSLMTPNPSALGPMIPAMEHRVFSVLTIAVVAGVALLVVLYGLGAVLMLIAGYLPD